MTRQCESLGNLGLPSFPSSEELNTFELDVVSKFDTIINVLRELEDQFTQARYEVLHKSKLEGKEGGKICAIKGRVIQNKQKYYRSIEGDIQSLMKIYNDQFGKISKEFTCLKVVSGIEEKIEVETHTIAIKEIQTYTTAPVPRPETYHHNETQSITSPFVKTVTVPSLKRIDSGTSSNGKKPISIGAGRPVPRPLFKASSTTEIEISKKYDTINNYPTGSTQQQHQQQNLIEIPEGPLNIPEDVEEEENQSNQVNRVRRGLISEVKSMQTLQNNRPIRSAKSHGFRLTYHVPSDSREDILMELPICGNN